MSEPHRLVVIGNGMAGARLVEHVLARRGAQAFRIAVFGDEPQGNYNRILLSGVLAGTHRQDDIVTHPLSWYAASNVTLHAGNRVQRVDVDAAEVVGELGVREGYDSLVFATGSRPFLPPIRGLSDQDGGLCRGVFVFRTLADCQRMIAATSRVREAVVIGGGLLGLEAARGLVSRGVRVRVVHLAADVMDAQLDREGSRILQHQIESLGIDVLTGRATTEILGDGIVEGIRFSDGTSLSCEMVVVAAGIRPDVTLARAAGLAVGRGILVDDAMACVGRSNLFAIGECAEHRGQVYGLVAPAWDQADVLADRITGRRPHAAYTGTRLTTKLKVAGLDVAVMGEKATDDGEVVSYVEASRGIYQKLIVRDNRLVGAILIGGGAVVPGVAQAFLESVPLPSRRSDLLFPPAGDLPRLDVARMPDGTRICDCNAVTKGQIVEAVLCGAASLRSVCDRTRAGTGCGSCRPEVQRIIDFACQTIDGSGGAGSRTSEETASSARYAIS